MTLPTAALLPLRRFVLPWLTGSALCLAAPAEPTAATSPFLPPPDAPAAASATAPADYEFVGMTALGQETLLGIVRTSDKRSFWIPLGRTANDITAVSFDNKSDRAVIRVDGRSYTLSMRQSVIVPLEPTVTASPPPAAAPAAPGTPPAGVPPAPLTPQQEKEMEARMLVTDLLEIGQQQRKAYEEAQRQAAARAKAAAAAPTAASRAPAAPAAPPVAAPAPK